MSSPADFQKHEKSQKICLKTLRKASCIFNTNFNDFSFHFGSQNNSQKLIWGLKTDFLTFQQQILKLGEKTE